MRDIKKEYLKEETSSREERSTWEGGGANMSKYNDTHIWKVKILILYAS